MEITLIRKQFYEECTQGALLVDGQEYCSTLEPHRIDWKTEKKVDGKTAIPEGRYRVVMAWSYNYKRLMPFICDVPHFRRIMIHSGNTHEDTRGCVLVGKFPRRDFIAHSRITLEPLRSRIAEAYDNGEDIFIEVKI